MLSKKVILLIVVGLILLGGYTFPSLRSAIFDEKTWHIDQEKPFKVIMISDNMIDQQVVDETANIKHWVATRAKHCSEVGVHLDHDELVSVEKELLDCSITMSAMFYGKLFESSLNVQFRREEFLEILNQSTLTTHGKQILTEHVLHPTCSAFVAAVEHCDKRKYPTLGKMTGSGCLPQYEKDIDTIRFKFVDDLCRDEAKWIFDFLEAKPLECPNGFGDLDSKITKFFMRVNSKADLCNVTKGIGNLVFDDLLEPCKGKPEIGQILRTTFNDTIEFWQATCNPPCAGFSFDRTDGDVNTDADPPSGACLVEEHILV